MLTPFSPVSLLWTRSRIALFVLALSFIPRPILSAQATVPSNSKIPTILANVDEVSLDLVVRGKKKKAITDLKPEDLAITDNGTAVKITSLRLATHASNSPSMLALVFDRMDTSAAGNARSIAAKVLKEVPVAGFSLSVMGVTGRLRLYQDFTSDRSLVTRAVQSATEADRSPKSKEAETAEKTLITIAKTGTDQGGTRVPTDQRAIAQMVLAALQDSQRIIQEQHTVPALASLLAVSRAARMLPGRKALLYFSQGSRFDENSAEMLSSIVGAANRSGTSIYTIDVNVFNEETAQGLLASLAMGNSMSMSTARAIAPQAPTGPPPTPFGDLTTPGMKTMISSQQDRFENRESKGDRGPLSQLALSTDGGFIPAGGNPKKTVQAMVQDLTNYYQVSYIPPFKEYDGSFRRISVKSIYPDVKVRSRQGYFAVPPQGGSGFKLFEAPLLKVLSQSQLPSEIHLSARIFQLGDIGNGDSNVLAIEVPISQLTTHEDPNTNLYSLHASVVAQIKNHSGETIEHFSEDMPRHGAMDIKEVARGSIGMQRHFAAAPGEYTLEAAVIDRETGKIGATRYPFSVSTDAARATLSDVVLVQHLEPLPEDVDSLEPMVYGKQRVVPDLSARLDRGVKQVRLFSVVQVMPQSKAPVRLEMTVLRDNEAIAQVPLQLRTATSEVAVPYMASIQTGGLPPGDYHIIESLTQGEKTTEKNAHFRIEGPELASASSPSKLSGEIPNAEELAGFSASKTQIESNQLVITSLPPGSTLALAADEVDKLVEAARKHALGYGKLLPNFVCVETTSRSVDSSGNGNWKRRDTMAELLRYIDSTETRSMVEHNGERTTLQRDDLNETWPLSVGEFGGLMNLVFKPESKTTFEWKESALLGPTTVQVFNYRVLRENASMALSDGNRTVAAGFHGLVFVDAATGGIRRITMEADALPRDFSIHDASMSVDYDYVTIGAHEYLMPKRATIVLQRGRRQIDLNEMAFRGYRRYASQTKIVSSP